MKNKKNIIIIVIIIVAYLAIAVILFGWENFINKFQGMSIMLSTGEKWQLKDGEWSDIESGKDYNWKKFDVYVDHQLFGNYDLLYNNKWYIFDENRDSMKYSGRILAVRGNKKYEVVDFNEDNFDTTGDNLLRSILEEKKADYPKELTYAKKVTLDIDGDHAEETIYTVSNAFTYETDVNKKFSLIFMSDSKMQVLYQSYVNIGDQYDLCVPKLNSIIDINKDSRYELIFECNYFSELGSCSMLYELKDGTYKLRKSC